MATLAHGKEQEQTQELQKKALEDLKLKEAVKHGAELALTAKLQLSQKEIRAQTLEGVRNFVDEAKNSSEEIKKQLSSTLDQSQANQRLQDDATRRLNEAANTVQYAAQSMIARHQATESALQKEMAEKLTGASMQDQSAGKFTADELQARQQARESDVARQVDALMQRQIEDTRRLLAFLKEMKEAILAFRTDITKDLASRDSITEAPGRLQERSKEFEERRDMIVAFRNAWDGRFSDVEAVRMTWEAAAKDQANTADGFAKARENFWRRVNEPAANDQFAQQVHRLLDKVGVEWQGGSNAPLLAAASERLEKMKKAAEEGNQQAHQWLVEDRRARLITIDHVADKSTYQDQTLQPANLRFLANADNSARGNRYGTSEGRKLDFENSDHWKERNQKASDRRAELRTDKTHDRLEAKSQGQSEIMLEEQQSRATTAREQLLGRAAQERAMKESELRDRPLRRLEGETEALRKDRQEDLQTDLSKFLDTSRRELQALQAAEHDLHERQWNDLAQAQRALGERPSARDLLQLEKDLEARFAKQQGAMDALWQEMNLRRNGDIAKFLQAVYSAKTADVQQEQVRVAVESQKETIAYQRQKIEQLEKERDANV